MQALRNLDVAVLSTTDLEPFCQDIVNVIKNELGYFFGAVALIDNKIGGLKRIAISDDSNIRSTLRKFSIEYKKQRAIPLNERMNLLIQAISEKRIIYTPNLYDIQIGMQPKEISDTLQRTLGMKGFFIYPLITKDKVIGIIYYCTLVEQNKLSKFDFEVMESFATEVARALDNILLYQNLKVTTQELAQANVRLKELDKLKDEFVSLASHELRTPMAAVSSYLYMALYKSDQRLSDKVGRYLTRAYLSTQRLINLVNEMLNVSRIESGKIEITPVAFDIITLVKEVLEEVTPKSKEKNINLYCLENKVPMVFGDPDKTHEVLLNLVGNSLKFTPNEGSVTVSFFADGQNVDISIKDTGTGIVKEDLGKLFQKFGRLDNSYLAIGNTGGTGLGLYISKRIVELMHGRIWASSEGLGKGSTFSFSMPIATADLVQGEQFKIKPQDENKGLAFRV